MTWIMHGTPALAFLALLSGCSGSSTPSSHESQAAVPSSVAKPPGMRLGNLMVETARRFEIAGRAADANRFDLAEFEVGEIEELFADDVPGAELPKEGPTAHIPAMARAFLDTSVPELKKAAAARDRHAFAVAFQHAASMCNACHQASAKGFIQVPSDTGKSVPDLEALPAPSSAPH
jgi:hypothetical protein